MKLTSIELKEFRGINQNGLSIDLDEHLTVLVGKNGVGKTTVLDGIAACLCVVLAQSGWSGASKAFDALWDRADRNSSETNLLFDLQTQEGKRRHQIRSRNIHFRNVRYFNNEIYQELPLFDKLGPKKTYEPLIVYYDQSRLVAEKNPSTEKRNRNHTDEARFSSFTADMRPLSELEDWFDRADADEARRARDEAPGYRDPQLEAIRGLVKDGLGFDGIRFENKQNPGVYVLKNGVKISLPALSGGERVFLVLLCDLARRLSVLFPDLSLEDSPGIVLIDEVELHLHPGWQRQILPLLLRVFKSCQFIVTTHSPQVLGAVDAKHIRVLQTGENGDHSVSTPPQTRGWDSNYVLADALGANERDPAAARALEDIDRLIAKGDVTAAGEAVSKAATRIEGHPPELTLAKQRLERRKRRGTQ